MNDPKDIWLILNGNGMTATCYTSQEKADKAQSDYGIRLKHYRLVEVGTLQERVNAIESFRKGFTG